jgi:transposase-like protein
MQDDTPTALGALQVDETKLKGPVDESVRSSVEETLNGLLEAEADKICRAGRYEHSADRVDTEPATTSASSRRSGDANCELYFAELYLELRTTYAMTL